MRVYHLIFWMGFAMFAYAGFADAAVTVDKDRDEIGRWILNNSDEAHDEVGRNDLFPSNLVDVRNDTIGTTEVNVTVFHILDNSHYSNTSTQQMDFSNGMSASIWVNWDNQVLFGHAIFGSQNATTDTGWGLQRITSNRLTLQYNDSTTLQTGISAIIPNTWQFITVVIDDTKTEIWVDGDLNASANNTALPVSNTQFEIGRYNNLNSWNGSLWCARVFNATLTESQILALYNGGEPTCDSLSQLWNNTLTIVIRDELTDLQINESFTIDFLGPESRNFTAENGELNVSLLQNGEYILRYSNSNYQERLYFFDRLNSDMNITLYALTVGNSTTVPVIVKDQNFKDLENATVQALRKFISRNTFEVVEMARTKFDGRSNLHLQQDGEFYKFRVVFLNGTLLTTIPSVVDANAASNGLNFQVSTESDPLASIQGLGEVEANVTFDSVNNNFLFSFTDRSDEVDIGCLTITRIINGDFTTINSSCSTSDSVTISLAVDNTTAGEYLGEGTLAKVESDGTTSTIVSASASVFFDINAIVASLGNQGMFLLGLLILGIGLTFMFEPIAAIIGIAAAFMVPILAGLTVFGISTALGILAAAVILSAIVKTRPT